jgi:hypothetical protein
MLKNLNRQPYEGLLNDKKFAKFKHQVLFLVFF